MWLPIFGLFLGLLLGFFTDFQISQQYASYFSIAVLAALDTLVGGIRANLEKQFDERVFISGFLTNIFLAAGLAFLGVHLGVDLYLAAIVAFGVRLFNNIAIIRRIFLDKWIDKQNKISTPRSE
ncbi:small basic family protein [Salipaludibacillus agaradhaerens]|uniref:Small basic family protein n=1 Tax=Salipaludibacillus agaradhaerens TaxID=76935 RepID=A0A9Q4B0K0_SALAG|nr:small basic family protein [Salipaludibacillus agaradhaerens]UJW58235.1 small basic family protein [Bacillus sp. A116_S68]MCR6095951.1 small basic family protein [Salipaludibacillus agaradhaerens]MCR6107162.1 small basic family protein [Salipaludibacillus agaradhaerens]MCR6114490.1 small basic family protein [Salipaludibacillus agaradhaerens]MCR6119192.1 small basic family protein [Salipaludibacillus agaradhaerens]